MDSVAAPGVPFTLAAFSIVIGLLVFVHEFGHYGVARMLGIKVDTFAVGFGRELLGWTDRHGTRWKLGWLPLGGYAKFAGDMNAASQPDPALLALPSEQKKLLLQFRPVWQRALVVAAGPMINFLFAILLFAGFFMSYGHPFTPPVAGRVVEGSAAAQAGLQPGDRITAIDGSNVGRFEDVVRVISINPGQTVTLSAERDGQKLDIVATPRVIEEVDRFGNEFRRGVLGVESGPVVIERLGPVRALGAAFTETGATVVMMADTLKQVISGRRAVEELGGPIRIAQFSGQSASLGVPALVGFVALISINLAFINLLPIPMLDGGHLLLYAIEAVRRRPLNPKVQEWAFMSGFALLMSLMLFLTWNDLASVGVWEKLSSIAG